MLAALACFLLQAMGSCVQARAFSSPERDSTLGRLVARNVPLERRHVDPRDLLFRNGRNRLIRSQSAHELDQIAAKEGGEPPLNSVGMARDRNGNALEALGGIVQPALDELKTHRLVPA